jgi:steroid 5-alpha reductase family enzyme
MKENRIESFIVISLIYFVASVVGIITFNLLNFELWLNLLIADVVSTVLVFIFSLILKNASTYDPYWSVAPIVIIVYACLNVKVTSASILVLIAICFWGIRLTANWAYTFKNFTYQDWRYTMLSEKTKQFYPLINFLGIHLFPTIVVYLCVIPAVYLVKAEANANVFTIIFFVLAILSAILQGVSDIQMHKYKKKKETPFIRNGVWKYSRHPNYLGEILMWFSMALLVVLTLNNHYYFLIGAIVNFIMFMVVSIPMADKRQSKKDGFLEYKKQTRMLLPIKK